MIITGNDVDGIKAIRQCLDQRFEMKGLKNLCSFLRVEVTATIDGYYLSHAK